MGEKIVPKGPNGQKRPADALGLAVMLGTIATGKIEIDADCAKTLCKSSIVVAGIVHNI